jgi:hypothetical protein
VYPYSGKRITAKPMMSSVVMPTLDKENNPMKNVFITGVSGYIGTKNRD